MLICLMANTMKDRGCDDDYDSVHADDTDGDDNNDCDDNVYDVKREDHDEVPQEVGSSSEEEEDDDDNEQEVNDDREDEFCSRVGRRRVLQLFDLLDFLEILTKVVSQFSPCSYSHY